MNRYQHLPLKHFTEQLWSLEYRAHHGVHFLFALTSGRQPLSK